MTYRELTKQAHGAMLIGGDGQRQEFTNSTLLESLNFTSVVQRGVTFCPQACHIEGMQTEIAFFCARLVISTVQPTRWLPRFIVGLIWCGASLANSQETPLSLGTSPLG